MVSKVHTFLSTPIPKESSGESFVPALTRMAEAMDLSPESVRYNTATGEQRPLTEHLSYLTEHRRRAAAGKLAPRLTLHGTPRTRSKRAP